jgi:hypothetical protein
MRRSRLRLAARDLAQLAIRDSDPVRLRGLLLHALEQVLTMRGVGYKFAES